MILYTVVYNGHTDVHIQYINAHHIMGINLTLTSKEQSCTLKMFDLIFEKSIITVHKVCDYITICSNLIA